MRPESDRLSEARAHLSAAEKDILDLRADYHMEEGFGLLAAIDTESGDEALIARNLGETYFTRFCRHLESQAAPASIHRTVGEPTLKRLIAKPRVAQALEQCPRALLPLPAATLNPVPALRESLAGRLLDKYLEGYSEAERARMMETLLERLGDETGSSLDT